MNSADFHSGNRQRLVYAEGKIVVLSAHTLMQRGNDMAYGFEQESNFWYLTGIEEADWWLIIDGTRAKTYMVAPTVSSTRSIFDGSMTWEDAKMISGADEVLDRDDADTLLRDLAKKHSVVYSLGKDPYSKYYDFILNPARAEMWKRLDRIFESVQDCRSDIATLRAIKQNEEIRRLKKAIKLTCDTFEMVRNNLATYKTEYELAADFTYGFNKHNASHAYDPIVASGKNACTLHYIKNDARLGKNDMLLLDIGAKVEGYAADISRTYSRGSMTSFQRDVHASVRSAHASIIKLLQPGLSVAEYQQEVDRIMSRSMIELGLIKNADDEKYRQYFPHAVSHGLGVDVHDSLGAPKYFEEGMVLTVEPGIYVPSQSIGVRVEDDILITKTGNTNLSATLSTEP